MTKFIVLDNVFDEGTVFEFDSLVHDDKKVIWHDKSEVTIYNKILEVSKDYFDLSNFAGYETWYNSNGTPDWHIDKEISISNNAPNHTAELPICSIIYYPKIEDLKGGEFLTRDMTIVPKSNRLIMFSSDIYHKVNSFTGTRKALPINPWNKKPMSFQDLLKSKVKKRDTETI